MLTVRVMPGYCSSESFKSLNTSAGVRTLVSVLAKCEVHLKVKRQNCARASWHRDLIMTIRLLSNKAPKAPNASMLLTP